MRELKLVNFYIEKFLHWKILCFEKELLTISDLVSFQSNRVLKQLFLQISFNENQSIPPPVKLSEIRTPRNATELNTVLNNLDLYFRNYKPIIRKIIKSATTLNVNLSLVRDTVKILFKSNLAKKTRKKKSKKQNNVEYNLITVAFDRLFISAEAQRRRNDETKKAKKAKHKKKITDVKRTAIAQRKLDEETMKTAKRTAKKTTKIDENENSCNPKKKTKKRKIAKNNREKN